MSVVNVKKMGGKRPKYDVYIGRDVRYGTIDFSGSKWQNPFRADRYGREKCLEMYEQHIKTTPKLWNALPELKGKILGCWCKPKACHGDVLLRLIEDQEMIDRYMNAIWAKYTKCPECGRLSSWFNPEDVNCETTCWGCKEKVKNIKLTYEEYEKELDIKWNRGCSVPDST